MSAAQAIPRLAVPSTTGTHSTTGVENMKPLREITRKRPRKGIDPAMARGMFEFKMPRSTPPIKPVVVERPPHAPRKLPVDRSEYWLLVAVA